MHPKAKRWLGRCPTVAASTWCRRFPDWGHRTGGRKLEDLCRHYEVRLDGAHSADADAIAACRVAWRIASAKTAIGQTRLPDLHELQVEWARKQAKGLADYFRRTPGKEHQADGVRGDWPFIPRPQNGA